MADPTTVAGYRRIARRLRGAGFTVTEVPGWETRGAGSLRPRGRVEHHTASSRRGGNVASLRLVTFGRADLRNALCNWYVARNGDIYLVAAGTAWHAGSGGWRGLSGNSVVSGTEAENDGVGEPWGERSLAAQAAISAEECREFKFAPSRVCDHREWTPRKIDRTGINSDRWRRRVARVLEIDDQEDDVTPADRKAISDEVVSTLKPELARAAGDALDERLRAMGLLTGRGRNAKYRQAAKDLSVIRKAVRAIGAKAKIPTLYPPDDRIDA